MLTRKSFRSYRSYINASLLSFAFSSILCASPVSQLYLAAGAQNRISVVQGNSVVNSWIDHSPDSAEYAIAVFGDVRTHGTYAGASGAQYSLSGTYLGTDYVNGPTDTDTWDGTSDGLFNYAWDASSGSLLKYSRVWTSPTVLFSTDGGYAFMGVTYDASDDSFWLSGFSLAQMRHYSRSGSLLGSFALNHNLNGALALDPADRTLWVFDRTSLNGTIEQWSRSGTFLGSTTYVALSGMDLNGGEFNLESTVPEPSQFFLLGASLAGLLVARRRG
jgi:hypothetical protein